MDKIKSTKKIAIIGAGLAGLTSAYRLQKQGYDVTLFEAKERVGGRVFTVLVKNYLGNLSEVELGGQNITDGGEAVNFSNLAAELGLNIKQKTMNIGNLLVCFRDQQEYYHKLVSNHDKNLQDLDVLATESENMGQLIEKFCTNNIFLKEALLARMTAYEGVYVYKQSIYHNIDTLKCMLSGGIAKAHDLYEHEHNIVIMASVEGGNAKLAEKLAEYLKGKIHLNKALAKIQTTDDSINLYFNDKSVHNFDQLILAIPAITFKNIDFSDSRICTAKLAKINSIAYGTNYKIALSLDKNRQNNTDYITRDNSISFHNHDNMINLIYVNDKMPDISWFIRTLSKQLSSSIVTEVSGDNYEIYDENISYSWTKDCYFQGSYSGYSTSISQELDEMVYFSGVQYKSLFAPVENRIFFAGEHTTILNYIGTMEAAVESGERIARAISLS